MPRRVDAGRRRAARRRGGWSVWGWGTAAVLGAAACAPARAGGPAPVAPRRAAAGGSAQARARQARCADTVTVGYGAQSRCDVTASVGSMAVDARTAVAGTSIADVLRGRVPGLDVFTGPTGQLSLRVRGARGILTSGEPLLVLDGMPVAGSIGGTLASLEPRDVARVDVLKDAGASAVYGSRAANGVVLITTRRR